jgi:hypothetical protein
VLARGKHFFGCHFHRYCAAFSRSHFFSFFSSSYHAPVPELDAKRAMRVVRNRLRPYIDDTFKVRRQNIFIFCTLGCTHSSSFLSLYPLQVGMIGSSAGGHLTATVLAYHDEGDARAADPIERKRYVKNAATTTTKLCHFS